jgi:hypothetical protein
MLWYPRCRFFKPLTFLTNYTSYLYGTIAKTIGCGPPSSDFKQLAKDYFDVTEVNRTHDLLKNWIIQLIAWNPQLSELVDGNIDELQIHIPPNLDPAFTEFRQLAQVQKLLVVEPAGMAMGTPIGPFASVYRAAKSERTSEIRALLS